MDKRNIGLIDEAARKSSLLFWNLISPICSPMNRCNDQIAWPPYALHLFRDPRDAFIGKVADKVHASGRWSRSPIPRDAARRRREGKCHQASFAGNLENRRGARLRAIAAGPSGLDPQTFERGQGFEQSGAPPVEDMVIAEDAAVDACGRQALGVFGTHPIVDALVRKGVAARNAGFEIYDARVG